MLKTDRVTTRNRGKQPNDDKLFAVKWHPTFTEAVNDFCYLLSRGYADNSVAQLVGNRYRLNKRQRTALVRVSASKQQIEQRIQKACKAQDLKGKRLEVDGFNLLILLESALSGAYIFKSRDTTYRDISSVHGSYKRVRKTEEAILLVGQVLKELELKEVHWYFDQPVSNSGRLKTRLLELSTAHAFNWSVDLVLDPDKVLAKSEAIVVSSDSWVLDHAPQWFNLPAYLIEHHLTDLNIIEI